MRDPERTREIILEAVEEIVLQKGIGPMTIEEVAYRAAVSKGGVLHHFPSKNALVVGVMKRLVDRFEVTLENQLRQDPAHPGAFTRAYLRAELMFHLESNDMCMALAAETRNIPEAMNLLRERCISWQRRAESDGLPPAVASAVKFAAEGMSSAMMFGLPGPSNQDDVVHFLLGLAGANSSPC